MNEDFLNKSRKASRKRVILAISSFLIVSSFISLAFAGYFGSEIKGFLSDGQALISGTFKDTVSLGSKAELLAEINLTSTSPSTSSRVLSLVEPTNPEIIQKQTRNIKQEKQKERGESSTNPPTASVSISTEKPAALSRSTSLCNFEANQNPSREVIFNEIAWMGSPPTGGKTPSETASDEWLELKNNSSGTMDLSGSQILDSNGGIKIIFDANRKIEASKFFLLERANDDSVPGITADKIYSSGLSNGGEWLKFFSSRCELLDELDASSGWGFFGGDNITKQTLERNLSGLGWHTSEKVGGTPRAENSSPAVPLSPAQANENSPVPAPPPTSPLPSPATPAPEPSPQAPHILISEILYDAVRSDQGKEFIELYNPSAADIDLKNWSLMNGSSSLASIGSKPEDKTVIRSNGYFLVGFNSYSGSPVADIVRSAALPNTSSTVLLLDVLKTAVDLVSYNNSVSPGQSYERAPIDGSRFIAQSNPTPKNSQP